MNTQTNRHYLEALAENKNYQKESEGLSSYEPPGKTDKINISQANIIQILLIKILEKLEDLEKDITELKNRTLPDTTHNITGDLEKLSKQLSNIKITEEGKPVEKPVIYAQIYKDLTVYNR